MERPTKFLLLGATPALLICFGGYLASIRDNSQLAALVEKCKAVPAKGGYGEDSLVCDPVDLARDPSLVGIQKQIVESQAGSGRTFHNAVMLAVTVFILFSMPAAWYFFASKNSRAQRCSCRKIAQS